MTTFGTRRVEPGWQLVTLGALALIAFFLVYPMAGMFARGVYVPGEGFSLRGYRVLFDERHQVLLNTLVLGMSVTALSIAVGGLLAYLVSRLRFRLAGIAAVLPVVGFVIPDIVVAQSWMLVLGNDGVVTNFLARFGIELPTLYGWFGLLFVMTLQNYPYAFATLYVGLKGMDRSLEEAAIGLGEPPWRVLTRVTIPLMVPSILAAVLLVFTHVINSFGVPAVLGGKVPVLAKAIYNEFLNEQGSHPLLQSSMSTLLVLAAIVLLWVQKTIVERRDFRMESMRAPERREPRGWRAWATNGVVLVYIALGAFPLVMVLVSSVSMAQGPNITYGTFTMRNFERAFSTAPQALKNSLLLATIATLLGTLFAMATAYCIVKKRTRLTSWLDMLLMVPLTVAGTVLGIALIGAFNGPWLVLTGGASIIVVAYFFRRMPFGVRSATGALYSLKDSIEEAAVSLGMRPISVFFRVILPVMWPAVLSAGVLIWVTTLSELSATLVLYSSGWGTIPVEIYQQIDSDRTALASAHSVILLAAVFLPLVLARLLGIKVLDSH